MKYFQVLVVVLSLAFLAACDPQTHLNPNILLIISDDQSYPHTGAYGDSTVHTPAFDRIAGEGVLFTHCFCPASQCSPSRAALLTGRNIWELEEAGTHASIFPSKFLVYTDILEAHGYHVGYTGKPWAPGNWKDGGRTSNPAGTEYNHLKLRPPTSAISDCDYAGNFEEFLSARPKDAPFCFWLGCREPHRDYELNSGVISGKQPDAILPPDYLPDEMITRSDLLDYKYEIDWFDKQVGKALRILEDHGEIDNTFIIITSDNGMPFPRAKANLYDAGSRVPLAIRWGKHMTGGRVIDDLVSFIDFAPTILEVAGIDNKQVFTGASLLGILKSTKSGIVDPERDHVTMGKERHNQSRPDNVGYPIRAIRTHEYLYIRNLRNERWPLGDPPYYYCHTTMSNPTKEFILSHQKEPDYYRYYDLIYNKRPIEELYAVKEDPDCINNLADIARFKEVKVELQGELEAILLKQHDPRMHNRGDIFESYPYYQKIRDVFPGFKEYGTYNPKFQSH